MEHRFRETRKPGTIGGIGGCGRIGMYEGAGFLRREQVQIGSPILVRTGSGRLRRRAQFQNPSWEFSKRLRVDQNVQAV